MPALAHCLGGLWVAVPKLPAAPHQLRLEPILTAFSGCAQCLRQYAQRDVGVTPDHLGFGLQSMKLGHPATCTGRLVGHNTLAKRGDPVFQTSRRDLRPAPIDQSLCPPIREALIDSD